MQELLEAVAAVVKAWEAGDIRPEGNGYLMEALKAAAVDVSADLLTPTESDILRRCMEYGPGVLLIESAEESEAVVTASEKLQRLHGYRAYRLRASAPASVDNRGFSRKRGS